MANQCPNNARISVKHPMIVPWEIMPCDDLHKKSVKLFDAKQKPRNEVTNDVEEFLGCWSVTVEAVLAVVGEPTPPEVVLLVPVC